MDSATEEWAKRYTDDLIHLFSQLEYHIEKSPTLGLMEKLKATNHDLIPW